MHGLSAPTLSTIENLLITYSQPPYTQVHTHALLFRYLVMSDSLRPHGLQHIRLPCPSPTPRACSNSCPSSQWWFHPNISSSAGFFSSCLQSFFPNIRVFSNELALHIRWPKYSSFSLCTHEFHQQWIVRWCSVFYGKKKKIWVSSGPL